MNGTLEAEGWTIVHQARQRHDDGVYYGQFLGARNNPETTEWLVATMHPGRGMDDGFIDGRWKDSQSFAGPRSADNADDALELYVETAGVETFVWSGFLKQYTGAAIDWYLAGPEVVGAPRLSAGWQESDAGPGVPCGGHTICLPFHRAKFELLQYLRRTKLNAMPPLTPSVTIDRHQAVQLAVEATGPVRFEYGYNTYWLAAEAIG